MSNENEMKLPWNSQQRYGASYYCIADCEGKFVAGDMLKSRADYIIALTAENAKLREALKEIAKGEGRFDREPLVHASNAVVDMKQLANEALAEKGGE